jgi:GTP-binding protein
MSNTNKLLSNYFGKNEFVGSFQSYQDIKNPLSKNDCCFLGRSNVGKSSIINSITRKKNLAKTSKTPGRTQSINIFLINDQINLVDLPGYGYAKVSKVMRQNLETLIQEYVENQLKLIHAYILIDAKVGVKNSDIDMFDLLSESNRNFSIIFTKIDKCSRSYLDELDKSMKSLMKSYIKYFNQFFFTSSKKFEGIIDVQKDIYTLSKQL